jgi:hypothetical protein
VFSIACELRVATSWQRKFSHQHKLISLHSAFIGDVC